MCSLGNNDKEKTRYILSTGEDIFPKYFNSVVGSAGANYRAEFLEHLKVLTKPGSPA